MPVRQALLIGVPVCKTRPPLNLPVARHDVAALQKALLACQYQVTTCGIDDPAEASRSLLRSTIAEHCANAPAGGTLLIYFSGHGIHHRGRDLLVPWDANFWEEPPEDGLLHADISDAVFRSRAATVAFIIDACREGVVWEWKAAELTPWSTQQVAAARGRCFVTVYSCSAGEFSHYHVDREGGYSLFTRALALALSPSSTAVTLGEVVDQTQQELQRLRAELRKGPQNVATRADESVTKSWRNQEVRAVQPLAGGAPTDRDWAKEVGRSSLWVAQSSTEEDPLRFVLQEQVGRLVRAAQEAWRAAAAALPGDPWRDPDYPLRVVRCLAALVPPSG
jgi:hypothetical protein